MISIAYLAGVLVAPITIAAVEPTDANAPGSYCDNRADDVTDSIRRDLANVESNDPVIAQWDWIAKESMMCPYASKCPPQPARDAILGFSSVEHGAALWHDGKPCRNETNLGRQLLKRGKKAAAATTLTARCESGLQCANPTNRSNGVPPTRASCANSYLPSLSDWSAWRNSMILRDLLGIRAGRLAAAAF